MLRHRAANGFLLQEFKEISLLAIADAHNNVALFICDHRNAVLLHIQHRQQRFRRIVKIIGFMDNADDLFILIQWLSQNNYFSAAGRQNDRPFNNFFSL